MFSKFVRYRGLDVDCALLAVPALWLVVAKSDQPLIPLFMPPNSPSIPPRMEPSKKSHSLVPLPSCLAREYERSCHLLQGRGRGEGSIERQPSCMATPPTFRE